MKQANKYNLKVEFSDGFKWDIDILAIDITWVNMWLTKDQDIKTVNITMLEKNWKIVPLDFGAISLNDDGYLPADVVRLNK
jgi:hypothetical protein